MAQITLLLADENRIYVDGKELPRKVFCYPFLAAELQKFFRGFEGDRNALPHSLIQLLTQEYSELNGYGLTGEFTVCWGRGICAGLRDKTISLKLARPAAGSR